MRKTFLSPIPSRFSPLEIPIVRLSLSPTKVRLPPKTLKILNDIVNSKPNPSDTNNVKNFRRLETKLNHHQLSHQSSRWYHVGWIIKSQFKVFLSQFLTTLFSSSMRLLNELETNQITLRMKLILNLHIQLKIWLSIHRAIELCAELIKSDAAV